MTVDIQKNRRAMQYVVASGLLFGLSVGLAVGVLTKSGSAGWHSGFWGGFLFAFAMHRFLKVQPVPRPSLDAKEEGFADDESLLHHGAANHWKGVEAVGGKLFLTDKRLRFRSHAFNVQRHDESYPRADIVAASPARSLGIIPNAIRIELKDGRRETFVVADRAAWLTRLGA